MFEGLDELPQLNKNLESLQETIELLSTQMAQLHKDIEILTGAIQASNK